jgi:predicted nuclease of restriction endonuclease-like RecB superfamily
MHSIRRANDNVYEFTFDGPASVLRETRRYGVAMAKFLPALLACQSWRAHAVIQTPRAGWHVALDLSPEDGLRTHLPAPDEFDSDIESEFARKWGHEPRDGWTLSRESDILHIGQKVFLPDFTFQHSDGRKVLLEIIGFWTGEYLTSKLQTLSLFRETLLLLAVQEHVAESLPDLPAGTIVYKTALKVKSVLEHLATIAERPSHDD